MVSNGDTKVKMKLEGYGNKRQHRKIFFFFKPLFLNTYSKTLFYITVPVSDPLWAFLYLCRTEKGGNGSIKKTSIVLFCWKGCLMSVL